MTPGIGGFQIVKITESVKKKNDHQSMKLASPWSSTSKFLFRIALRYRRLLPQKKCQAFGTLNTQEQPRIERIYVINLNRQPARWTEIEYELKRVRDWTGDALWNLTEKYAAVDAKNFLQFSVNDADIDPIYTLGDQLFVEPQPLAMPTLMELDSPIEMSRPEIAVAHSHIGIWRQVVEGNHEYVLVLEDDVWFRTGFAKDMNQAWAEITAENNTAGNFDILYLSYEEVKNGAPKTILSNKIFRPIRGLWNLSGYVISRKGAAKLLQLLPCRGPVDLWLNHQFEFLDVRAIKKTVISQRPDFSSTNSYSILPALTKIGAITCEGAALFQIRPSEHPVFVFGPKNSGLTSLAMALSMLGYRCCSDLQTLPSSELELLLTGKDDRVFDAYVNISALASEAQAILEHYPHAKFILTTSKTSVVNDDDLLIIDKLYGTNIAVVDIEALNKWQIVCEHLKCAPPICSFPELADIGQRRLISKTVEIEKTLSCKIPKRDKSPWVIGPQQSWCGIHCVPREFVSAMGLTSIIADDCFKFIDPIHWLSRDDTFTDNLALFRPSNIELRSGLGVALSIRRENLGVREYSAASLTSRNKYLYGRFEATIKVSNAPGVVTGFFLHRDSPRQEIDIEIAGNQTDRLLVNVFYNPGGDGAKFDYGYRGAATYIDLGFDASESYHQFAIEWGPTEIRWFVDNNLVHRRVDWDPTPIPHLPMSLHANVWPCRSRELAGRLVNRQLPTTTFIKSIAIEANQSQT
jgi:GR25 family glycosyltransferase involved in LPS biosynthesis